MLETMVSVNEPETIEVSGREDVAVHIPESVYQKLFYWVIDKADGEISGMGSVSCSDTDKGRIYTVDEIWLFDQVSGSASTKLSAEDISKLRMDLYKKGKCPEGFQLWWHSHADMDVFWSGTDMDTRRMLIEAADWNLSIVVNKSARIKAALDINRSGLRLRHENVPVYRISNSLIETGQLDAEFDSKVKAPSYGYGDYYGSYSTGFLPPLRYEDWASRQGSHRPLTETELGSMDGYGPSESLSSNDFTDGDRYFISLSSYKKRVIRKWAKEKDPLCYFDKCPNCETFGYLFHLPPKEIVVCYRCIKRLDKMSKKFPPYELRRSIDEIKLAMENQCH